MSDLSHHKLLLAVFWSSNSLLWRSFLLRHSVLIKLPTCLPVEKRGSEWEFPLTHFFLLPLDWDKKLGVVATWKASHLSCDGWGEGVWSKAFKWQNWCVCKCTGVGRWWKSLEGKIKDQKHWKWFVYWGARFWKGNKGKHKQNNTISHLSATPLNKL